MLELLAEVMFCKNALHSQMTKCPEGDTDTQKANHLLVQWGGFHSNLLVEIRSLTDGSKILQEGK